MMMPGHADSGAGPGDGERAGEARTSSMSPSDKPVYLLRAAGISGTLVASPLAKVCKPRNLMSVYPESHYQDKTPMNLTRKRLRCRCLDASWLVYMVINVKPSYLGAPAIHR